MRQDEKLAIRSSLIGYTGFIGGNLARQFEFGELFNSKNIGEIRGKEFDLVVCSGVSALKWWANQNPVEDRARVDALLRDLETVRARTLVVISTVDVYPVTSGLNETFDCHSRPNHAYGTNRLYFEDEIRKRFEDVVVLRISGVFGPGLKKNVIYDLMHDNCLEMINAESSFQYYNVANLWRDLQRVLQAGIKLINFVGEPIRTRDIIECFFAGKPVGAKAAAEVHYDIRTIHGKSFGGPEHYLTPADEVLREIGEFVQSGSAASG